MFKIGDEGVISQYDKRHTYGNSPIGDNPWGVRGGVVEGAVSFGNLPLYVSWDNGKSNSYDHKDLDFYNLGLENK